MRNEETKAVRLLAGVVGGLARILDERTGDAGLRLIRQQVAEAQRLLDSAECEVAHAG